MWSCEERQFLHRARTLTTGFASGAPLGMGAVTGIPCSTTTATSAGVGMIRSDGYMLFDFLYIYVLM